MVTRLYRYPVDLPPATIGDGFGVYNGRDHPHTGQDFPAPMGTPIHATCPGLVVWHFNDGSYGNSVCWRDDDGVYHLVGHMQGPAIVSVGQWVETDQIVGYVGSTGMSTGPHVHYQMCQTAYFPRDLSQNYNPMLYVEGLNMMSPEEHAQLELVKQQLAQLQSDLIYIRGGADQAYQLNTALLTSIGDLHMFAAKLMSTIPGLYLP